MINRVLDMDPYLWISILDLLDHDLNYEEPYGSGSMSTKRRSF